MCASWVGPLSGDDGTDGAEPVRRALVNATRVAGCSRGPQQTEFGRCQRLAPGQPATSGSRQQKPACMRGPPDGPDRVSGGKQQPDQQQPEGSAEYRHAQTAGVHPRHGRHPGHARNSRQLGDPCSGLVGGGRRLGGLSYHGGSREPRPDWARHHRGMMRADRRCARRRRPGWQGVNQLGVHQQHAQPQQRSPCASSPCRRRSPSPRRQLTWAAPARRRLPRAVGRSGTAAGRR